MVTFSGLAKVAIFTTNVDAENECLINHKCVCGVLNRHFCQTRVTCWPSVHRVAVRLVNIELLCHSLLCFSGRVSVYFYLFLSVGNFLKTVFLCVGKASSFAIFGLCVGLSELQMCLLSIYCKVSILIAP
jgi:hypothetical protein